MLRGGEERDAPGSGNFYRGRSLQGMTRKKKEKVPRMVAYIISNPSV